MSPRSRVALLTAAAALAAAGVVVGVVSLQSEDHAAEAPRETAPRPARTGNPPLVLELAFRADREARDLRRAQELVNAGNRARARPIFARYDSLEARVGSAFAAWPDGTIDRLNQLAGLFPRSALVLLHLGLARLWAGEGGAEQAWREAVGVEPDSPYAVRADSLLHPRFAPGLPSFVPSFAAPRAILRLPPAQQLPALERAARRGGVRDLLLLGVALQRVGRPVSAARVYAEAARRAPRDVEAQVAAAVGRFDKDRPADAFSRLGPLSRRFPGKATVRLHLGLLLLWTGAVDEAKRQLRLAGTIEPRSPAARAARRYLTRIEAAQHRAG